MDKRTLHNTVRLLTGSAADFLDDYFESDILKGYLASSSIIGTKVGPRSQGSGLVLLYHSIGEHDGEFGAWAFHKGGNGGFTQVLARAAQSFGAEIVARIAGRERHHEERPGDRRRARGRHRVPRHDRGQRARPAADVPRARRPARAADATSSRPSSASASRARRPRSTSPSTGCRSTRPCRGRGDQFRGFTNIGPSMDYLERAFDDAKYGWYSQRPYMDCAIQSTIDPDMAPPGKHVMSTFIAYTPYQLRESDWDTERQNLGDTVQATFESFFPGFGDLVLHREVVTPLDIERTVGLSARATSSPASSSRRRCTSSGPAPGWSQYRTPIDGYYQCGSGTHPGGCVMGAPGQARRRTDPQGPRPGLNGAPARRQRPGRLGSVYWATLPQAPQPRRRVGAAVNAITAEGLVKVYKSRKNEVRALDGVDLEVARRHRPRPARAERRRQDHDRAHPRDPAQAGRRPRDRRRASTSSGRRRSCARSSACPASTRPSTRT